MEMIPVNSSAIAAIGYDSVSRNMKIRFHNNHKTYDYCNVPKELFQRFSVSSSKGSFYYRYIKDKYNC